MDINNEEEREKTYDFMAKISYFLIQEIYEKRGQLSDTEIIDFLIDSFKYNISLCPEAALEAAYYE